ncbi:hypothetical protein CHARACLAT_015733 [Characodon lateralis]|uniref:Uncharacterized protein n=1 Tax=Characodon lateralis TaxID=208331 RepID=A0ABU7EE77_9TELE|nr:hypothetical protein [Characodon lateralis]
MKPSLQEVSCSELPARRWTSSAILSLLESLTGFLTGLSFIHLLINSEQLPYSTEEKHLISLVPQPLCRVRIFVTHKVVNIGQKFKLSFICPENLYMSVVSHTWLVANYKQDLSWLSFNSSFLLAALP